jgi:hypothetical protein
MCAFASPATPVKVKACPVCEPTAASDTWDFQGETNAIFKDIQSDAAQVLNSAAKLQSLADDVDLSWDTHALQLDSIRDAVNDMGQRMCRLGSIRRVDAPWQQEEIDRIRVAVQLLADNTGDAILFGSTHPKALWLPAYRKYTLNLFDEAEKLTHSMNTAVAYANASQDAQRLKQELGMPGL